MGVELFWDQEEALARMKCGCILNGGTGAGKSITALAYYFQTQGGIRMKNKHGELMPMINPVDLYIITTATKRDNLEWEAELLKWGLSTHQGEPGEFLYHNKVVVDSWNNITKYTGVVGAFFIFDEQRAISYSTWGKALIKIAGGNQWIMLSATPGDKWVDYIPVFVANGFYKNKTDFMQQHYGRMDKYYNPETYVCTAKLNRLRRQILVPMPTKRTTEPQFKTIVVDHDILAYKRMMRERFDYEKNEPIENASALCYKLRSIVNSDPSRMERIAEILREKGKAIIFYNFDYELEILKRELPSLCPGIDVKEHNGHKHERLPDGDYWAYLCQYTSACEGWNCVKTDTMIFYSQSYSYKVMEQAKGRIDRRNTPYKYLYYYTLRSNAGIDLAISKALKEKRDFNERVWDSQ